MVVQGVDSPKPKESAERLSLQGLTYESEGAVYFRSPLQNAKAQRLALIQSLQALQDAIAGTPSSMKRWPSVT